MRSVLNRNLLSLVCLSVCFSPDEAADSGAKQNEAPKDEAAKETTETTDTLDVREKDEYFGSTLQKASIAQAVTDGHIKLKPQSKTQKTRGKGSRELTYNWDDIEFIDTDGVLAFVGGDEKRLMALLSDVASDMNQQTAWETLFEISDEDKLVRQAAKRIAQVLGISEDEAEKQVRKMISDKATEKAVETAKA